jgi:maltose O-acetyltransferase
MTTREPQRPRAIAALMPASDEATPSNRRVAPKPSWLGRAAAVVSSEVCDLQPRKLFVQLLVRLLPRLSFCRLRAIIYRLAGPTIGEGTLILGAVDLRGEAGAAKRLTIGKRCMINTPCFFDLNAAIVLGDDVNLAHHVVLVTSTHHVGWPDRRAGLLRTAPIHIEDGVWLGANVTVLPGITIGRGSIVAAGSVVTVDVPPNQLVGGMPARLIRTLPEIPELP